MSKKTKKTKATVTKTTKSKQKGKPASKKGSLPAKVQKPEAAAKVLPATKETKISIVINLLKRPQGATVKDIVAVTGWQQHTVRGVLSGNIPKKGYSIVRETPEGGLRTYKIAVKK